MKTRKQAKWRDPLAVLAMPLQRKGSKVYATDCALIARRERRNGDDCERATRKLDMRSLWSKRPMRYQKLAARLKKGQVQWYNVYRINGVAFQQRYIDTMRLLPGLRVGMVRVRQRFYGRLVFALALRFRFDGGEGFLCSVKD